MFYINMVVGINSNVCRSSLSFKRKLRDDEKPKMEADMNQAFDFLGIKNRALIIHGSVYPDTFETTTSDNSPVIRNHYVGSPYHQKEFNRIVKMHGFNCIQQGPNGELGKVDNSPYRASIFAKNPLFINFGELTTDKYANILSKSDINEINLQPKSTGRDYEMSDFDEAKVVNKILMDRAYNNFKLGLDKGDVKAKRLEKEYNKFKQENNWVESYGVAHVLSDIHGTDNFHEWDNEIDKHLFKLKDEGNQDAIERYETVKNRSSEDIEKYMFTQFIIDKQEKTDKIEREQDGIKIIGDLLVGFSYTDELINEDAFLPGWKIGAEYGGPCNSPQVWNNPLPDPNKLFNGDGSLGKSGQLLYNKVKKAAENVENLRIDNAMGLVDPYVYKADTVHMVVGVEDGVTSNIVDRGQLKGGNLSGLGYVDPYGNYPKILSKIVIPALKESGIDPKEAVWENLGEQTDTFKWVFEQQEKLPGIILSTGGRTEELCFDWAPVRDEQGEIKKDEQGREIWKKSVQKPDWSMIGSHDNIPTFKYLNQGWIKNNRGWESAYLGGYLNPLEEDIPQKDRMVSDIENNSRMRLKAKYAELMRGTQNIQLTFSDVFAIDKVYNTRDDSKDCWKPRLTPDYNDRYHNSLITEDRPVMNMPELVGLAVNAKAGMLIATDIEPREKVEVEAKEIVQKMNHWSEVLKEKED